MAHAIRIFEPGGPEKLSWQPIEVALPGPGEVLVRNTAVGLNFIDVYHRSGLYPVPAPFTPGSEGAGVIEKVGPKVREFKVGDRVAYADPIGSYAELVLRPASRLVKIPSGVTDQTAAAVLLKGMTAEYLLRRTYPVKKGELILVHAAAGGVGQILCQWGKHLGAQVIGIVSVHEKEQIAKKAGCKHVIVTEREEFPARVREITRGKGVPVVYDGSGKDTFQGSLDCLATRGLMVSYGNASGPVPPFAIGTLAQKGSLYLTRPTLHTYTHDRKDLVESAKQVFALVKKGVIKVPVRQTYPLKEAAQAHRDLEARKTSGSTVFLV